MSLTARIVERGALRYTPAGLPALDLSLQHDSEVEQLGRPRKVSFSIRGRAVGEAIVSRLAVADLGAEHAFAGFLGAQRNGRGIVLHIDRIDG